MIKSYSPVAILNFIDILLVLSAQYIFDTQITRLICRVLGTVPNFDYVFGWY